jgi:hypothetical protein
MYDHDPADVETLGWEEFTLQQWESIFFAYRSWTGLRTLGRRWSDLVEAALGCSQEVADKLVNAVVINGPARSMDDAGDAADIVHGMTEVLARIPAALGDMAGLEPGVTATLLKQHARLQAFIQTQALGPADDGGLLLVVADALGQRESGGHDVQQAEGQESTHPGDAGVRR